MRTTSLLKLGRLWGVTLTAALPLLSSSCSMFHKDQASTGGEYASYPNDGKYHPYGQSGSSSSGQLPYPKQGQSSHYQEYSPASSSSQPDSGYEPQTTASSSSTPTTKKKKHKTSSSEVASAKHSDDTDSGSDTPKPKSSKSKSSKSKVASNGSHHTFTHTVKSGETLRTMAKKYGTTVAAIKKVNHKSTDSIHEGQKLKIPNT